MTFFENGEVPTNDMQHNRQLSEFYIPYPSPHSHPLCPDPPNNPQQRSGPATSTAFHSPSWAPDLLHFPAGALELASSLASPL